MPLPFLIPFRSGPGVASAFANVPFEDWGANDALEALAENTNEYVGINRDFIEGDHWQGGDGWVGPKPGMAEVGFVEAMMRIETSFCSRNVIYEVCDRHANGVVGKEPRWRWTPRRFLKPGETPTAEEIADIALIESWMTEWWNLREAVSVFQKATMNALWAERGPIRIMIPAGYVQVVNDIPGVRVKRGDIPGAMSILWPEAPDPESATVYRDPDTKREIGITVTRTANGTAEIHLTFLEPSGAPVSSDVAAAEQTTHRVFNEGEDAGETFVFNIGGRLLINEIVREPLITEQIRQGQRALNLALSMVPRTVVTAGFLERAILAGQMPGEWVDIKDPAGRPTGRKKFVAGTPKFGPGTTNYIAPIAIEEDDGHGGTKTVMTNPDIKWREPSDPKAAIAAKVSHYQDILEEADQAHILITSDATPSGNSRDQARVEYEKSLDKTCPNVNRVGRWFMETLMALSEYLAGVPGKYTSKYRCVFECSLDAGPLTPDERRENRDAADKGYMSKQSCMERNGTEDVDAENAQIQAEGAGNVGQMEARSLALANLAKAKFPLEVAVELLGFPKEIQGKIVAAYQKQQEQEQKVALEQAKAKAKGQPKPAASSAGR